MRVARALPRDLGLGLVGTGGAAGLYLGAVTGALTVDLGVGRRARAMREKVQILERAGDMLLAAHRTPIGGPLTAVTVEAVVLNPPEQIRFRLLRGLGRFTLAAVDALGLDRFHLVVHDIGGPIGFELAAVIPQRVASLTILNTLVEVDTFRRPWSMQCLLCKRGHGPRLHSRGESSFRHTPTGGTMTTTKRSPLQAIGYGAGADVIASLAMAMYAMIVAWE